MKRKLFKIIHIIIFRRYCHFYTLQMINLDNIVNNNNEEHNEMKIMKNGHIFQIILTEFQLLVDLDPEKQIHYLI